MLKSINSFFKRPYVALTLYLTFAVITIASILIVVERSDAKSLLNEPYRPVYFTGEYSKDGGVTYEPFVDYDEVDFTNCSDMIFRGHLSRDIDFSDNLYMLLYYIDVSVYVNDRIVYTSDTELAYSWDAISHTFIQTTDLVTFELHSDRKLLYNKSAKVFLERLNCSTKNAVLATMLQKHFLAICGEILMAFLGLVMLLYRIEVTQRTEKNYYGLISCGLAIILGAMTCFINIDYITLMLPRVEVLEYIDTLLSIFMMLFLLIYFQRYMTNERSANIARVLLVLAYITASTYMIFRSLGDITDHLALVSALTIGVLICVLYVFFFFKDISQKSDTRSKVVLYTSILLLVSAVIEMGCFLFTGVYLVSTIELGMLSFGLAQFWVIAYEIAMDRNAAEKSAELENELIQSQISVMISQIQPHFLFNALGTIRALCTKDPVEARNALDFFAKYLRANMESLDRKECIPFSKEMEHVKSYLYIEKLRFGDRLNIEYDIQTTDFMIPSMAIQTLAENGVKHGLLAKPEGGTLSIRTMETANCFEIQVIDDGVGIDSNLKLDDSRTHVGIENTRLRLAGMCNGTLAIGSKLGQGTIVTICIPKGGEM